MNPSVAVAAWALAVEGGLDKPPLAQPDVAFREPEPVAEQWPEQLDAGSLDEVAAPRHQHASMASGW
jgi:hypothetical protein